MSKILSFSGHRWYNANQYTEQEMLEFMGFLKTQLAAFFASPPHTAYSLDNISGFVCGGALGFDMAAQQFAIEHRIPLVIALPFDDYIFTSKWSVKFKNILYEQMVDTTCVNVEDEPYYRHKYNLPDGYHVAKPQWRNQYMVDNSDATLFYWNQHPQGGTYNCMKYVEKKKHPFHNMWVEPPVLS